MRLLFENADEIATGVWSAVGLPHELIKLGSPRSTSGKQSVLLAGSNSFDPERKLLIVRMDEVEVLNLGSSSSVIVVDASFAPDNQMHRSAPSFIERGRGDAEFLDLVRRELRDEAAATAKTLLDEIRRRWPGDLKRGERNNFSNTPDNFWYVIVQPRSQALSVTVRGNPSRFSSKLLELKDDRPGYTRFTVKKAEEVSEALAIIELSKRKLT